MDKAVMVFSLASGWPAIPHNPKQRFDSSIMQGNLFLLILVIETRQDNVFRNDALHVLLIYLLPILRVDWLVFCLSLLPIGIVFCNLPILFLFRQPEKCPMPSVP